MQKQQRRILLTSALPYANGDIHLGHMVEHLITDFWTRFQKQRGHDVLAICADDTHGAPMMVEAKRRGITPEELIAPMQARHEADFRDFLVEYDNYSSTHTAKNRAVCDAIYAAMQKGKHIEKRGVKQCYCLNDQMFLPDRFVKGTCPKCGAADQYGDSCDHCSAVYSSTEVKDPACTLCGQTPEVRESEHHFFLLSQFQDFLQEWVPTHTCEQVAKKLSEWFNDDLKDWCFTRDEPYFGFAVPGTKDKYYYVWFDAPCGYISSTQEWAERHGRNYLDFWQDEQAELYHNIGKDIIYFHSLFWPAMLKTAGYKTPKQIFVHGMLTVNGEKLSKSRGTFINARTYLNHLDPEYLRYYYACKLTDSIQDIDLNLEDFVTRVNADLIGKIVNLASRSAQMLQKKLDGRLGKIDSAGNKMVMSFQEEGEAIAQLYEERQFAKAMRKVRELAEEANRYFDEKAPWQMIKNDPEETRTVLTNTLNLFRILTVYLTPILPVYAQKVAKLFGEERFTWESKEDLRENLTLSPFEHLMTRVDAKQVEALLEETRLEIQARAAKG